MDLVRDLLDHQLVDPKKRRIGKVDGVVLVLEEGQRPRVDALEVGAVVLARRLHPRLARWTAALLRRLGAPAEPEIIPWTKVRDVGLDVEVDVPLAATRLHASRRWLRRTLTGKIPGG